MDTERLDAVRAEIEEILDAHYEWQANYTQAVHRRIVALRECGYTSRHVHTKDCPFVTRDWSPYQ